MKRKITELEQKLLDKGFKLECKHYTGKKSQFVYTYEYIGVIYYYDKDELVDTITTKVLLNAKKDHIESIQIMNQPFIQNCQFLPAKWLLFAYQKAHYCENELLRLEQEHE